MAQNSLGDGRALDSSTSSLGRENLRGNLPSGVRNNQIRNTSVLQGRSFGQGFGHNDDASLRLLQDAAGESDASYNDALNNSTWYWDHWSQQSTQFLKQDRSYFNPSFVDNWSTLPKTMSEGRTIRSYSHEWNEKDAANFSGEGTLSYDNWSKLQQKQYHLGEVLGSGYQTPKLDTSPIPVGDFDSNNVRGYFSASPLSGVSLETIQRPTTALGFSAWDSARALEDDESGIGMNTLVKVWRSQESTLDNGLIENRLSVPDQYINLLDELEFRAQEAIESDGVESTTLDWLDEEYANLQDELAGILIDESDAFNTETEDTDEKNLEDLAVEEIFSALRHGEQISTFSGVQNSRFNELTRLGETALAKGEYFLAQKRFDQALQFIPGHPMATAGLAHANIGAGLYLSASHVLHSLLSFQPEMIDVEYGRHLLPPKLELVRAGIAAKNRLDSERDGGAYAFLLAYIGHQIQDEEMLQLGLESLEQHAGENDRFATMLRAIWEK